MATKEFDIQAYTNMVKEHHQNDDPYGWCDSIYKDVNGDYTKVFWADLEPSSYLVSWLKEENIKTKNKKACVIGCGVGDDAKALEDFGFEVTAFDISHEAIKLCKNRYPKSKIDFIVADLFDYPKDWIENFDLVYECNTIQVLPDDYRKKARVAMSNLLSKDGYILVSCRSRDEGTLENIIPLPLSKSEIDEFVKLDKLEEISFLAYDDTQEPPVPHFFAIYQKK